MHTATKNKETTKSEEVQTFLEKGTTDKAEEILQILKATQTSLSETVFNLSCEHKVVGIFIKWFGCPMCAEVIEVVGKMFPTFLKLNTLPIIFHQENENDAKKAMERSKDLNVKYIPFCKTTRELQRALGISSASMGNHMEAAIKSDLLGLVVGPKRRNFTIPVKVINPFSQFGVISIESGVVKKKVVYSTLHKRLDFGLFLNDVGSNLISPKKVSKLMRTFPDVVSEEIKVIDESEEKRPIEEWSEIEKVLSDELGRYYFKAHATNEYSVENVLVYEEVSMFKGMPLQKDFKKENQIKKAKEIYNTFLTTNSFLQLNITDELGNEYKKRIEQLEKSTDNNIDISDLFEDLMIEVRCGVIKDTFARFKLSRYFQEYKNGEHGEKTMTYLV
eukprot:gene11454-4619_t